MDPKSATLFSALSVILIGSGVVYAFFGLGFCPSILRIGERAALRLSYPPILLPHRGDRQGG